MKSFLISIVLFLSANDIGAQEYFFNFVDGWSNNYSIETVDGYVLMGLKGINGGGTRHEFFFNDMNFSGDVLDTIVYELESVETTSFINNGANGVTQINDNNFIIAGYVGLDLSESNLEGVQVNYDVTSNEFTLIKQSQNGYFTQYNTICHPDDSTLLVGELTQNDALNVYNVLYNFDMDGNERWHSNYEEGCEFCDVYPKQILPLSNGNIASLYTSLDYSGEAYHERERSVIIIVDGITGEVIGEPIIPGDEEGYRIWSGGMLEMDNGDLLISFTDSYYYDETGEWQPNPSGTVHVERYSIDGQLQSGVDYVNEIPNAIDDPGRYKYRVTQMQWLDDGHILLSGTTGLGGLLMKIDPDGNLIWQREHFPAGSEANESWIPWFTHIHHALATSDGGFLCTGEYLNTPGPVYPSGIQTAFAIKVDEFGCLESGCQVGIKEYEKHALEIYPNPSNGAFNITLPENEVSNLLVYDVSGKVVLNEFDIRKANYLLDLSEFEDGIYFVNVQSESGERYFSKIVKR